MENVSKSVFSELLRQTYSYIIYYLCSEIMLQFGFNLFDRFIKNLIRIIQKFPNFIKIKNLDTNFCIVLKTKPGTYLRTEVAYYGHTNAIRNIPVSLTDTTIIPGN